jgi:branched-chain amino acid transport system permease protein
MLHRFNGPQTLGNGRAFWACAGLLLAAALIYPVFADPYDVGNFAYFLIWVFMALGLCLMWGYGGMLSFGQTFFFGLAGYGYGVLSVDFGSGYGLALGNFVMEVLLAGMAAAFVG